MLPLDQEQTQPHRDSVSDRDKGSMGKWVWHVVSDDDEVGVSDDEVGVADGVCLMMIKWARKMWERGHRTSAGLGNGNKGVRPQD